MANETQNPKAETPNHSRQGTKNLPGVIKPGRGQKPKVKITQLSGNPPAPAKAP